MKLSARIEAIVAHSSMSIPKYATAIGVKTPQAIRDLISGKTKTLSADMQDKILSYDSEINKMWLLTGEGEMLNPTAASAQNQHAEPVDRADDDDLVPLLPVEAMAGPLQEYSVGVELSGCRKIKSPVKGADWAIQISGESMTPDFRNGMIIYIKKLTGRMIPWGHVLVVDTLDGVVVKEIYPVPDDPSLIEARSTNPKFPPFFIEKSLVIGLYRVLGGSFINSTI